MLPFLAEIQTCHYVHLNNTESNNEFYQSPEFVSVETSERDVNPSWKDPGTLDSPSLGISTWDSETLAEIVSTHCFGVTTMIHIVSFLLVFG